MSWHTPCSLKSMAETAAASARGHGHEPRSWALSLGALGVVYGDIGTSPLYAIRECFVGDRAIVATQANVLGVLSLVTWSLTLVVSIKYLTFMLRADHDGEGGILALMELVKRHSQGRTRKYVLWLGILGTALLYGDGMITPSISVLSAIEGLDVAGGSVSTSLVVPLTLTMLTALFVLQRLGTAGIGWLFGPVMLVWFIVLALGGLAAIISHPAVLAAVSPVYALRFLAEQGLESLVILGFVFLVVTGAEALYATLGHFGRRAIVRTWYAIVFPSLGLNYFGQGALIIERGSRLTHPFYELFPEWALYPMVFLATAATIIASQAIISGIFSLTFQAIQLGYLPSLQIRHTSSHRRSQIYIPTINWILLGSCVALVLAFERSGNLAAAYGVAIAMTMTVTTLLYVYVARRHRTHPVLMTGMTGIFLAVDLGFTAAASSKLSSGGWVPLAVAAVAVILMTTWYRGQKTTARLIHDRAECVRDFLARQVGSYRRVPGNAVYLAPNARGTPQLLARNLEHNRTLHRQVVIYTAVVTKAPYTNPEKRLKMKKIRDDITRLIAYYGFMERIDTPADIARARRELGLRIDPDACSYFIGNAVPLADRDVGMSWWRASLYSLMARNTRQNIQTFSLPPDKTIELGAQIQV